MNNNKKHNKSDTFIRNNKQKKIIVTLHNSGPCQFSNNKSSIDIYFLLKYFY